jgi:predicted acylesterase/phospholipase RssA
VQKFRLFCTGFLAVVIPLTLLGVTGCGLPRHPVPLARISDGQLAGFSGIRYWDVEYNPDVQINPSDSSDCSFLALSGGGAKGAFGAGFLCGWTESGNRPNFRIVTGISTGALIAPLAFAGPEYDATLKQAYTTIRTKDILDVRGIFGIFPLLLGESYAETRPLEDSIKRQISKEVLRAVAEEHAKGRRLYVGTTNLDAQRFVVWDMGAIASSGRPDAHKLFRKVMLASASIPGAFPPVYFNVEVEGKKYDEMHADGGVITEVFGYGPGLFAEEVDVSGVCRIYVIRNGKLASESKQVPRRSLRIMQRSFSTLMKAHSWGDMYRLHGVAERDKVDFNYVSIPDGYVAAGEEMFDPEEMRRLFDLGFEMAKSGYEWRKAVPGFGGSGDDEWIWTPSK